MQPFQPAFRAKIITFLITLLLFSSAPAQDYQNLSSGGFVRILNENGLSQNTVHAILQDRRGFIWFATEDGLNKYDGYKFTVYKNDLQDKNSIPDNFIWTIFEDKEGNLWVGTNSGGVSIFNRETEKFNSYKNNPEDTGSLTLNNVRIIYEDRERNLWIGTENGLDKFDRRKKIFIHYKHSPFDPYSISNNVVLSIFEDSEGDLWFGTDGGIDRFDKKTNRFFNYSHKPDNLNSLSNNVVLDIYQDRLKNIWVGTINGLNKFDKKKKIFERYFINSTGSSSLSNNRINSVLEDDTGILWVGTGEGLYQLDRTNKKFNKIKPSAAASGILENNNVLSLYEDNSGLIWIGTAEDGIVKYDRERVKFIHYKHDPFNPNSLSHNTVRSIYQDNKNLLWIGTLGGGLNRFDPAKKIFTHYKNIPGDRYSLSDNSISSIYKDSFGFLWVGTWGSGLNRSLLPYNNSAGIKFVNYRFSQSDTGSLRSNIIQAIFEDSRKYLWIGTGTGLSLYDRKKNRFINFTNDPGNPFSLSSNQVQSCILEDKEGNIWVGTWNGLNKISALELKKDLYAGQNLKFRRYRFNPEDPGSISDERIISAYEDSEGSLWFGSYGGGLNKLIYDDESGSGKFVNYNIKDGVPSNIIYRIEGDKSGNLWLSTDNGLSRFNPSKGIFRNYDVSDGLQGNQFFWGASCECSSGDLLFGGTNGLNAFKPENLKNNNHIPPIVITDFQIFNKTVEIGTEDSPLKKSITSTEQIELPYNRNVFSFEFSALDFTIPSKNNYAYMMEGFDDDWIYSANRRFVTYTNLDPGMYIFRVKGSNNDGVWNKTGTSVIIKILPPLWRTPWFITLVVILLGAVISLIIYFRVKHLLDIERLRTKLAADLHDNIGSSLTEISILSEVIFTKIKPEDADVKKTLSMISSSSRDLIDNMSDIVWLVNPKRDSLYDLILRLRDTYSELSSYTNISFKSENIKSLEKISLSMEHRQHLYLIFKEAINNCITHSGCSEITLDASVKGGKLQMILKDNGKGFCPEQVSNGGNGLSNIIHRAKSIGGKLDIFSKPGEGTVIHFEGNIS